MKMKEIRMHRLERESAVIYAQAIVTACAKAKVKDPRVALLDTDDYPALTRIPMVEFSIGWLTGVAESHDVLVEQLWDYILPPPLSLPPSIPGARWVPLTRGKFALVDKKDFDAVTEHAWNAERSGRTWRAQRMDGRRVLRLHRVIMNAADNQLVDHKNGDGLDNRRGNLRIATKAQNAMNTGIRSDNKSGFKGVTFDKSRRKWFASIRIDNRTRALGRFATADLAALAYDRAARDLFGEFAVLNYPGMNK